CKIASSSPPIFLTRQGDCRRLVSGGKDSSLRVWDVQTGRCEHLLTGHSAAVTAVRWAGCGLIFSASQDRLIFAWRPDDVHIPNRHSLPLPSSSISPPHSLVAYCVFVHHCDPVFVSLFFFLLFFYFFISLSLHSQGVLVRQMRCHGHWVTCLALSTDGAIRVHVDLDAGTGEDGQQKALNRYQELKAVLPERLASGSDDFTAALWYTEKGEDKGNSPQRLTGPP
uniref:WD_REPEATS_REGION domain-containing protein n=1 Tax=Eptatretus burgeri TaxID=7764 RepID=A0A8C4QX10_EPTBU